tara:strand:- start:6035 stop:8092 length:2058 start_codon:yes stop_codon:yes gene_type:complete
MGFGIALASGFMRELNTIGKEKRMAEAQAAANAAAAAEADRQALFQFGLDTQRDVASSKRELEANKRQSVSDSLAQALEDGTITPAGMQAIGKGFTFFKPEWVDLSKTQAAMDAAANTEIFKGNAGLSYTLELAGDKDSYGKSAYDQSRIFWDSWEKQLSTQQGFDNALEFFSGNEDARDRLQSLVTKNERELRVGNINKQRKANVELTGLQYIDLSQDFGSASRLFDELGFQNVEEESLKAIGEQLYNVAEDEQAILFPTRDTSDGGLVGGIFIPMKKTDVTLLDTMASRTGYASAQAMVSAFSFRAGQREEGMTDQDFASKQNAVLMKAVQLEKDGYGDMLSNPALMDDGDTAKFYGTLKKKFGKDRQAMVQAVSLLVGTPEGAFVKTRKYRYSGNVNQNIQAIQTGSAFVENVTGLKIDDFNEGFKAQDEAVAYIDRLMALEQEIGEKVGTGWIRDVQAITKTLGVQFQQGFTAVGSLFNESPDFQMAADDVSQSDLQATIRRVYPRIELNKISESEAIRLTLAAKMARAVDPAGRLSNQDFEIQLRRLGDKNFSTPQSIRAALQLVRKEFAADLEYKTMLKRVSGDKTALTPQVARTVQAHIIMRDMERTLFGAKGFDEVAQTGAATADAATGGADATPVSTSQSRRTLDGNPLYKGSDGLYYLDPEATQKVPEDRVKDIK